MSYRAIPLLAAALAAASLLACLPQDDDLGESASTLTLGTGGGFGGGGTQIPPDPDDFPHPLLYSVWRTDTSVKLHWTDKSTDESYFSIDSRSPNGLWRQIGLASSKPGNYLGFDYYARNLEPGTDYCFRIVAHRSSDRAAAASPEVCTHTPSTASCPEDKLDQIVALATPGASVKIDCNVNLEPGIVVTKQLLLDGDASGVVVDLNHAIVNGGLGTPNAGQDMIQIYSTEDKDRDALPIDDAVNSSVVVYEHSTWTPPRDVVIENGVVRGSIRIWGMAKSGEGDGEMVDYQACPLCPTQHIEWPGTNQFRLSSKQADHTATAQANAPSHITLDHLKIIGHSKIPLYFGPGVTNSRLTNSEITGSSHNASIYLGAESAGNLIKNNHIHAETAGTVLNYWDRPQINIDSSANNKIIDNLFESLNNGGIYLYRNCGENGVARHQKPEHNQIINNRFRYVDYGPGFAITPDGFDLDAVNPAVYIGARDRGVVANAFSFCGDDNGIPYGSGISDRDYAQYTVVMQNQIYVNDPIDMIRAENYAVNSPSYIAHNATVTDATVSIHRAGCFLPNVPAKDFLIDGETYDVDSTRYYCSDGNLSSRPIRTLDDGLLER